ncbi:MAG TPA: bifunctional phosphoribosylaminoimidazolecarboxamide formyltransferase/IMP cyclohydrolase [Candidatus Eisenbacteria bacterium]|nr:bifunctional phosphoribosylaminoimidazolecarboxamide formyltransferase/IMP cyclohydrolase [Candidatus Eisenbacteria bacterium]
MPKIRRALLSVSDKRGLLDFARVLAKLGVQMLSTGGTAKLLADAGLPVTQVSDYTGFPEMLDGRVKTLHPKIHGGLLGRRDLPAHAAAMERHGIEPIDLVVVNLYPFRETIAKPGVTFEEAIEDIDIGGPSMLRSAAKNHESVTVIVDPLDYEAVRAELERSGGEVSVATNRRLAQKVFHTTSVYDGMIADYLGAAAERRFGQSFHWGGTKAIDMRYGENPHQQAALYGDFLRVAEPLHGKELSYNNVVDIDAALALGLEFLGDAPRSAVAILKHNTPCGVGLGDDAVQAWDRAFATDPESPFGGVIISTTPWTLALATKVDELFTEVLIAPEFAPDALELLKKKKNRRLVRWHPDAMPRDATAIRGVAGGLLVQDADRPGDELATAKVVTKRQPTPAELDGLRFAWKVVKHVKSNAIVFASAVQTLAVGGGQTSRVEAIRNAVARARREKIDLSRSVLASDAFFPFPDGLEEAVAAGATAVVQPGGSTRDAEVVKAADARGVAMLFTGVRHFRH